MAAAATTRSGFHSGGVAVQTTEPRPLRELAENAASGGGAASHLARFRTTRPVGRFGRSSVQTRRACWQEAAMAHTKWSIKGREFVNCNCSYGCPCQFDGLPTHGHCQAVGGFEIEQGHHGSTKLDGLKFVGIFRWPGAIHEGKGEAAVVIDERATEPQRAALLRILTGQDTEPGATVFNVFASTFEKLHDPIFAPI